MQMRIQPQRTAAWLLVAILTVALAPADLRAALVSEIPAGTRFLVELRDKLDANKIKRGKKFEVRTLEALRGNDGSWVPAGAKLKGRVSYVESKQMILRFERIETRRGTYPVIASLIQVRDEKDVERKLGQEGEVRADTNRGKSAAIGAAVAGGIGAAVGAKQGGGKGAAIGAGTGAAIGALIGAATGGKDLVLQEGARLELQLDRPLLIEQR